MAEAHYLQKFAKSLIFAEIWKINIFCQKLKKWEKFVNFYQNLKNHQFLQKFENSSFFVKNWKKSSIFAKIWKIIIFGGHLREKVDLFTTVVCCIHCRIHCWMLFVECWIQTVATMLQQWEVYQYDNAILDTIPISCCLFIRLSRQL